MQKEPLENNIQVILRVRPPNEAEKKAEQKKCIEIAGPAQNTIVIDSKSGLNEYTYDWVAGEGNSQSDIFAKIGEPMAASCLEGYNSTIFAYGQTGAGKTYTMKGRGISVDRADDEATGLMPRVLACLFSKLTGGEKVLIKCSYLEIYNEQIIDLLNPNQGFLQIREDLKKRVFIEGLTEDFVANCEDSLRVLVKGDRNRHVASTSMNLESSRSHSVFSLTIQQEKVADGVVKVVTSRMNFVDLAGSERQKLTNTTGDRLKEAGNINKSLTVLGGVINSLVEISEGKKIHVRYRDSKLTFLLRDSLGGNSKTTIIANVSPVAASFQETLSTLKFAQRAKLIKNSASINEENSGGIESLKNELQVLKEQLQQERLERAAERHRLENQGLTAAQECEVLQETNKNSYRVEQLLKESIEILTETEKKLQYEYKKKEEFNSLFNKAVSMYQQKEIQLRTMVELLQDKNKRQSLQDWSQDEEVKSLQQTVAVLQEDLSSMPSIMKVYHENLLLKNQILYANIDGKPSTNILRVLDVLRRNYSFSEEVIEKLNFNNLMREKLVKRFEKLCLGRGMTSEDLSKIALEEENEELKTSVQKLNQFLMEKTQVESDLKHIIEIEKKRFEEARQESEKTKSDLEAEIAGLEKRIEELNMSYRTIMHEGSEASNSFKLKEVELKDQIDALTVKVSEGLKKLARSEERFQTEKKSHEAEVEDYEKKIHIQNLDVMRLQEEIAIRKSSQQKTKEELSFAKSEIDSLNSKLKREQIEKQALKTNIAQVEGVLAAQHSEIERFKYELEKRENLESEMAQIVLEKQSFKEEIDTLQQSLEYLQRQLEASAAVLEDKNKTIQDLQLQNNKYKENESSNSSFIKQLEEELAKQTESNSPYNIAIRENHSLRTMVREIRADLDQRDKSIKQQEHQLEDMNQKIETLTASVSNFKSAYREANLDNQHKTNQLKELNSQLSQIKDENHDLTQNIKALQAQSTADSNTATSLRELLEERTREVEDLKDRVRFEEKKLIDLKESHTSRFQDLQKTNDRLNEKQMKYLELQQKYDTYLETTERETKHLQAQLSSVNEQNKNLILQRIEKEEQNKTLQEEVTSLKIRLASQMKEYRMTISNLQTNTEADQSTLDQIKEEIKKEIKVDQDSFEQMRQENANLKNSLNDKLRNYSSTIHRLNKILEELQKDFDMLKSHKNRADKEIDAAQTAFKYKESENLLFKEQIQLSQLTQKSQLDEIKTLQFEKGQLEKKLRDSKLKCEEQKIKIENLTSDYELLMSMSEYSPVSEDTTSKVIKKLRIENDVMRKQLSKTKEGKKFLLNTEFSEQVNNLVQHIDSEETKELIMNIFHKMTATGIVACNLSRDTNQDPRSLLKQLEAYIDDIERKKLEITRQENQFNINQLRNNILMLEANQLLHKVSLTQPNSSLKLLSDSLLNKRLQYTSNDGKDLSPFRNRNVEVTLTEKIKSYHLSKFAESHPMTNLSSSKKNKSALSRCELLQDIGKRTVEVDREMFSASKYHLSPISLQNSYIKANYSLRKHPRVTRDSEKPQELLDLDLQVHPTPQKKLKLI